MNEASPRPGRAIMCWHYLGLALFWASSMLTFRSSILLMGGANTPGNNTFVVIVSFVANMTVLFAISALVEKASENLAKIPSWIFCAAILTGYILIRIAGEPFLGPAMGAALFAGALLCGIGYGYFWGSWADVLGRIHPSTTMISVPISFLLTAVIFVAITLSVSLLHLPGLLLIFPLPILSLLCLEHCRSIEPAIEAPSSTSKRYIEAITSLVPLIIASLVLSCLFGFMWETTVLSTHTATEAHELPLVANVIAAILLLAEIIIARRKVDLTIVYTVLIPVLIILFVVIPFFWHDQPVVLNAVISAIYGIFDVIIWYMVVSCAYDFAVSGFVVGGIVRGVSILSRLIGIGIGYLIMLEPDVASGAMIGMCIGAVYILVMLLWFLYRNSSRKIKVDVSDLDTDDFAQDRKTPDDAVGKAMGNLDDDGSRDDGSQDDGSQNDGALSVESNTRIEDDSSAKKNSADDEEEKFRLMAEDYGLTRREAEVLPYLARGRSAKVIADALFVSEPTIRTHTRRILEKTCLHSKQELIDLVEKY